MLLMDWMKEQLNETRLQGEGWDANIGSHAYKVIGNSGDFQCESPLMKYRTEMHLKDANFVIEKLSQDLNLVFWEKWKFSLD